MLVRCPECRAEFRLRDYESGERVIKYLCPQCDAIVRVDLQLDEVQSSSSSSSFRQLDRRRTVLVADDAPEVLEDCARRLSDAGYHVLTAADGEEALQRVREEHPDLVLLDLLMPKMTGFDVLREMRHDERIKDTPVLAMSSVYKGSILEFLHQIGAQGFLDKNQVATSLIFRVQALLPASQEGVG